MCVVDPSLVANDVVQTVFFLALPGLLWLLLFLIAWEDPALARASGFTRRTFWLLLPGALLASFSYLPFFGWGGDILSIDLGGGVVPIVLSLWLVGRVLGDRARLWAWFLSGLAAVTGLVFAAVIALPTDDSLRLLVVGLTAVVVGGMYLAASFSRREQQPTFFRAAHLLALTSAVLDATYLTTSAIPGYGIVSTFPAYLLVPVVSGAVTVGLARPVFRVPPASGLALAYAVTTFGVLVGADVLNEPPLYATGGEIFSIGGAGTGDLLYLSGLIAIGTGIVVLALSRERWTTMVGWAPSYAKPAGPSASVLLRQALRAAIDGRAPQSIELADRAVDLSAARARELFGLSVPAGRPVALEGLALSPWMVGDRRNLSALTRARTLDPRDATRAWLTARWLIHSIRESARVRFGRFGTRALAFLIDLVVLTAPMAPVWYYLSTRSANGAGLLTSIGFNAAIYAYAALGVAYFVLAEGLTGTTVGKSIVGLEVQGRSLGRPGGLPVLLRNLPKLVPLTALGLAGATGVAILTVGGGLGGTADLLGVALAVTILGLLVGLGVIVPAVISWACMLASPEGQRIGDWFAGTWVVVRRPTVARVAAVAPSPAAPSA